MNAPEDSRQSRSEPISVLLVDDHAIWRDGMRMLLADTEFTIVGEASSGRDAIDVARQVHPRIVLMDIRMGDGDGFEALKALKALAPTMAVIMLTTYDSTTFLARALAGGAAGYLLKGSTRQEILFALRTVADGEMLLSPGDLLHSLCDIRTQATSSVDSVHPLTPRELEVLLLVATGLNNRDIAHILFIGVGTVKSHVEHILQKLNVSDRVQAAVWAARTGLLPPSNA